MNLVGQHIIRAKRYFFNSPTLRPPRQAQPATPSKERNGQRPRGGLLTRYSEFGKQCLFKHLVYL